MTNKNANTADQLLSNSAAKILLAAAQTQQWIPELPAHVMPSSLEAAYRIQEASCTLSKRIPNGWKIGCTSDEIQQLLGSDGPIAGRLFKDSTYRSNHTLLNYRTDMRLVEAEFAFVMATDLLPIQALYDKETVLSAVESIFPTLEVVHERYTHWQGSSLLEKVADNSGHGSLITGLPLSTQAAGELGSKNVTVNIGNKTVATGNGSIVLGDPYNALLWLVNMLSQRGLTLHKGDIVTSGSCTGIIEVPQGVEVVAEFDTLGSVSATFG